MSAASGARPGPGPRPRGRPPASLLSIDLVGRRRPAPQPPPTVPAVPAPEDPAKLVEFAAEGEPAAASPPEAPPAAAETDEAADASARTLPPFADIEAYWRWLARGRRYPAAADLDEREVARRWPYSLLIYRAPDGGPLEVVKVFAGPSAGTAGNPFARDRESRLASWVLELAQRAARRGAPEVERRRLELADGWATLVGRALPCGDDPEDAGHLLCHVEQAG